MKIEEQELQALKGFQQLIAESLQKIGYLESQKHNLLHALARDSQERDEVLKQMEEKYGKIEIDLADGSYTKVE